MKGKILIHYKDEKFPTCNLSAEAGPGSREPSPAMPVLAIRRRSLMPGK